MCETPRDIHSCLHTCVAVSVLPRCRCDVEGLSGDVDEHPISGERDGGVSGVGGMNEAVRQLLEAATPHEQDCFLSVLAHVVEDDSSLRQIQDTLVPGAADGEAAAEEYASRLPATLGRQGMPLHAADPDKNSSGVELDDAVRSYSCLA